VLKLNFFFLFIHIVNHNLIVFTLYYIKIAPGGIMIKQETPLEAYNELIDLLLFFVDNFGIRNPEKQREIDQRIQLVREALLEAKL
jgi:hypothetical protein